MSVTNAIDHKNINTRHIYLIPYREKIEYYLIPYREKIEYVYFLSWSQTQISQSWII